MEVSRSGTSIRFWDVAPENLGFYYCAFFTGEYCQRFHEICLIVTKYPVVHFQPGDRVVLPCHSRTAHWRDVKWRGPHSHIDLWSTAHQDPGMHMLNGSRTGNFSLIIPSVSSSHSGRYACVFRSGILHHEIVVCSRMESLVLMLSPGSSAVLACDPNPDGVSRVQWHHQRGDDAPELILDSNHTSVGLKPSQRGRVDVSNPKTCLIISEPSAEDSGLYRCRVWRSGFCSERKILLQYKDHFSPFYVVYSALVAFSLLVMICAVIYVNMK
uniref:Ig-like domain-containing protein n=1 Tax=Denticeps clupeoides TaxID=299321 RepID=A0AAY4C8N9_9TELE